MLYRPSRPSSQARESELTSHHKLLLAAIAEAALPAGNFFPAAGAHTVVRAQAVYDAFPPYVRRSIRTLLAAMDGAARITRRAHLYDLPVSERLEILERWAEASMARRMALRILLAPLKIAHFDDPAFHEHIGCVYEFEQPRSLNQPRYMTERVHGPDQVAALVEDTPGRAEIECDVVIIGSGAGGAVVARELAELGHAVVVLEEGQYFDRRDFDGRVVDIQRKLYRNGGWTYAVGDAFIPIPLGVTVGGSTTVNSGTCYRTPGRVLARWRDEFGLRDFTDARMDSYFDRVEQVLQVETAQAEYLGGAARVVARGCQELGLTRHKPLRRNAPECDGRGVCCFGCPTDAKRSTNISYVPLALRAGAELFTGMRATRILTRGDRAVGVVAQPARPDPEAGPVEMVVRARAVVVACGTIMTPVLLDQNGLCQGSGQLGKHLSIHPATGGIGVFDETIAGYNAIPQGYTVEDFHEQGLLFEGASAPLEITLGTSGLLGQKLIDLAEAWDRAAMFGFMIEDTSLGRVRTVRDRPLITYHLDREAMARIQRGVGILGRIFLAAGARRFYTPVFGFDYIDDQAGIERFENARIRPGQVDLTAYHPLGTARMGISAKNSVVDQDHQSHEVAGLYIIDGASVPSALGVNPQVTIMAMATRAAERLDRTLSSSR